jgi:hypothetical protein
VTQPHLTASPPAITSIRPAVPAAVAAAPVVLSEHDSDI